MPVDVNRAGFVRHTGLAAASRPLPRALLPMAMDNGVVNLAAVRDPADPTNPASRAGERAATSRCSSGSTCTSRPRRPPASTRRRASCSPPTRQRPLASVPVKLTVHDFVLPDERHLS